MNKEPRKGMHTGDTDVGGTKVAADTAMDFHHAFIHAELAAIGSVAVPMSK